MTLAFTALVTEAMFMFSKYRLIPGSLHSTKVTAHWVTLFLAGIAHTTGYAVIYYNKELNNSPHRTSWHGSIGFVTSLLFWLQLSVGVFAKYPNLLKSFAKAKFIKANHALFGTLIFSLGMVTMILALWSDWFTKNASPVAFYLALAFYMLLSVTICGKFIKKYVL